MSKISKIVLCAVLALVAIANALYLSCASQPYGLSGQDSFYAMCVAWLIVLPFLIVLHLVTKQTEVVRPHYRQTGKPTG